MKKTILVFSFTLALIVGVFYACQKEKPFITPQANQQKKSSVNNNANSSALSAPSAQIIEEDIAAGSTMNIIKSGIKDEMEITATNSGITDLQFCTNSSNQECSSGITLKTGETKKFLIAELNSGSDENLAVTNLDRENPGHFRVEIIIPPVKTLNSEQNIESAVSLSLNDPVYVAFRKSPDFKNYNEKKFGELNLEKAMLISFKDGYKGIRIPFKISTDFYQGALITYLIEQGKYVTTVAVTQKSNVPYANGNIFTGKLQYFESSGKLRVTTEFARNFIINVTTEGGGGDERPCGDIYACYKGVMAECEADWKCHAISLIMGIYFDIAVIQCCAIYSAVGCKGDRC